MGPEGRCGPAPTGCTDKMTVGRYLAIAICKPFIVILGVLAALFASYCLADVLANAVDSLLPAGAIAEIVLLKLLISLEVLIPISLFAGVVLGFGRLYSDSEMTAMAAIAISPGISLGAVLTVSGYMAFGVAGLSLMARPWAYRQLAALSEADAALLNVGAMAAGTFYTGEDGGRTIYLTHRNGPQTAAQAVFVWLRYPDHIEVIHAGEAKSLPAQQRQDRRVDLTDTHIYDLGYAEPGSDRAVNAQSMVVDPSVAAGEAQTYSTAAMSSARLAAAHGPGTLAELQWRLSTPVSTLLLGLCGLPLSRVSPRQSRYAKFGTAILIYSVYYLVCMSARSLVQQGIVPGFPGLWWAPALLGTVMLAAWFGPAQWRRFA
jgi:lipopolysaccharide export system permease protein